jgi:hypothetical protein
MTAFAITIIRNTKGPLTKSFTLQDGQLKKTTAADLVEGVATQVKVEDLCHFATILEGLDCHEAIAFGVSRFTKTRIVTQNALRRGVHSAVCRDRAHFFGRKVRPFSCWISIGRKTAARRSGRKTLTP